MTAVRRRISSHVEEPVINLTPLIDVVFVILIMFIVVVPLLELDRVDLASASQHVHDSSLSAQSTGPIHVHVRKDNSILLNQRPVTLSQLKLGLKQAKREHPSARPQLFHDKQAHFGVYQSVKNAAEDAGFAQMDIILKPV